MMKRNSRDRRSIWARRIGYLAAALIINLMIFCGIPRLSEVPEKPRTVTHAQPILLTRYKAPAKPKPQAVQPQKVIPRPVQPESLPRPTPVPPPPKVQPEPKPIEPPKLNFKINPELKTDMPVAPPPKPKPKPKPRPKPKPKTRPKPKPVVRKPPKKIAPKPEPRPAPTKPVVTRAAPVTEPSKAPSVAASQSPASARGTAPPPARPARKKPPAVMPSEFGIGDVDHAPKIIKKIEPQYPYRARRRNIKGEVTVRFLVSKNGRVERLKIVKATPKGVFEKSVLKAVQKWRFMPGKYKGRAVATWVKLPIKFNLKE